jgi:glycosyltransferase involved in cell wall biosynthesis
VRIAVICGLSEGKLTSKLAPILDCAEVDQAHLIRRRPLHLHKIINWAPPSFLRRTLPLAEFCRCLALLYVCWRHKPDLLIAIFIVPHGVYAAIAGRIWRIPVIQLTIGSDVQAAARRPILRRILQAAFLVGVRGSSTAKLMVDWGIPAERLINIPNVLDAEVFSAQACRRQYDVVWVGNFTANKRVDLALKTLKMARESRPGLRALLLSPSIPRQHPWLPMITAESDWITLKTAGSAVAMADHLNSARVLLMTSDSEGLPMAMIEALSCGLPVVVPDVGDMPDLIQDGVHGFLAQPGDASCMAAAITRLLDDEVAYERIVSNVHEMRQRFVREYSREQVASTWAEVLRQVSMAPV